MKQAIKLESLHKPTRHIASRYKIVINWYIASGFTGLFNTKDHGATTLVIILDLESYLPKTMNLVTNS